MGNENLVNGIFSFMKSLSFKTLNLIVSEVQFEIATPSTWSDGDCPASEH